VREIEELKAIHREQLQRLQHTDQELESVTQAAEQLYLKVDKDRVGYQRKMDQCAALRREITQRTKEQSEMQLELTRRENEWRREEQRLVAT
jgi:hypothetical protein